MAGKFMLPNKTGFSFKLYNLVLFSILFLVTNFSPLRGIGCSFAETGLSASAEDFFFFYFMILTWQALQMNFPSDS